MASRLAFASLGRKLGWQIRMYSLDLGRFVNFPGSSGTDQTPAWSPDGKQLAFSSSRNGNPQIWISDANGGGAHHITSSRLDLAPVWNPKTGNQIAWVSGRTGLPQVYIMNSDGSGIQRVTDRGYATSPSWSPDGQFLAVGWNLGYSPNLPGGQKIVLINVATLKFTVLPADGTCDFPSWAPDARHIVFACSPDDNAAHSRIYTMLSDGSQKQAITGPGADMPNWSWK